MIPDFNDDGYLPPGIYVVTVEEVVERYGSIKSLRRKNLTRNLLILLDLLKTIALGVYVDGSYITQKISPGDIDLLVILKPDFDSNSSEGRRLAGIKSNYKIMHLHIFSYRKDIENHKIDYYLNWFTHTKDDQHKPKGIIYIEI